MVLAESALLYSALAGKPFEDLGSTGGLLLGGEQSRLSRLSHTHLCVGRRPANFSLKKNHEYSIPI